MPIEGDGGGEGVFRTIMGSERDWKRIGRGGIEEGKERERLILKWEEGLVLFGRVRNMGLGEVLLV